jgi:hypothetical protein
MPVSNSAPAVKQAGWRIGPWTNSAKVSRMTTYNLMDGKVRGAPPLPNVKVGKARIITMAPADYLALCAEQAGA